MKQDRQVLEALHAARDKLLEQDSLLQRLTANPLLYATVLEAGSRANSSDSLQLRVGSHIRVIASGFFGQPGVITAMDGKTNTFTATLESGQLITATPRDVMLLGQNDQPGPTDYVLVQVDGRLTELKSLPGVQLAPGDVVKLSAQSMQIVDVTDWEQIGETAVVRHVRRDTAEVDCDGTIRVVLIAQRCGRLTPEDRVILDPSLSIATRNLGKPNVQFAVPQATGVTWNDIGGLAEAKQVMIEAIEMPYRYRELYRHYGKQPLKGVLLYGPPGCGKTMLGKAAATALARLHGGQTTSGFYYIKGPEILSKFIGVAEATIRQIFAAARSHLKAYGYPPVIFIDEADALLGKRGSGISSDIERTIVPMFLAEMDGLEDSDALVILATNRADVLDSAVVRDKRIDRKVKVDRPTQDGTAAIFELYLKDVPLDRGGSVADLAGRTAAELFKPEHMLYTIALKNGTSMSFTLAQLVNGAMIAGIVDQATSLAMQRDIQVRTPSGLRYDDLLKAVDSVFQQNRDLGHRDEIADFVYDFREDVAGIQRLRSSTA